MKSWLEVLRLTGGERDDAGSLIEFSSRSCTDGNHVTETTDPAI